MDVHSRQTWLTHWNVLPTGIGLSFLTIPPTTAPPQPLDVKDIHALYQTEGHETISSHGEPTNPSFPLVLSNQERESRTPVSHWRNFS